MLEWAQAPHVGDFYLPKAFRSCIDGDIANGSPPGQLRHLRLFCLAGDIRRLFSGESSPLHDSRVPVGAIFPMPQLARKSTSRSENRLPAELYMCNQPHHHAKEQQCNTDGRSITTVKQLPGRIPRVARGSP